jgi:hypothetical protein
MTAKKEKDLDITVIRPTFLGGEPLKAGEKKTLPRKDALELIGSQKAKLTADITADDKDNINDLHAMQKIKTDRKQSLDPNALGQFKFASNRDKPQGNHKKGNQ